MADRPLPSQLKSIESGGIFDAALYLTRPGPHYLDGTGLISRLSSVQLNLAFEDGSQQLVSFNSTSSQQALRSLAIVSCGEVASCLWSRSVSFPPNASIDLKRSGRLSTVSGLLVKDTGEQLKINGVTDFVNNVKELWY